jgi:hypothetical protein
MYLDTLINELKSLNIKFEPCTNDEINEIEEYYKLSLPKTYVEFLRTMGKGAGSFMRGSSCFYKDILTLKEWSCELLKEDNFQPLTGEDFVFWMHQGYQFVFFKINAGDNPPVFYYLENQKNNEFNRSHDHLSEFYEMQLLYLKK